MAKNWKYKKYVVVGKEKGKYIRKWFYGDKLAEINANIQKYMNQLEEVTQPSFVTFSVYSEHWKDAYKEKKATNTREMYENALNKFSDIDKKRMIDITTTDCQRIINKHWEHPRTCQIIRMTLNQIFTLAITEGIIKTNPIDKVEIPKYKSVEKRSLTSDEVKAVEKAKLNEHDRMLVTILMKLGLRPGEAFALQKSDFDFENAEVHITKSVEMPNSKNSAIKTTKTDVTRTIPLPKSLIPLLKDYIRSNKSLYLFHRKDGSLMNKSGYRRCSERILKAIENAMMEEQKDNPLKLTVSLDWTLYTFRHHRATELYYLCQQGVISTKKAAQLMGHQEQVFLKTYSHIDEEREDISDLYGEENPSENEQII